MEGVNYLGRVDASVAWACCMLFLYDCTQLCLSEFVMAGEFGSAACASSVSFFAVWFVLFVVLLVVLLRRSCSGVLCAVGLDFKEFLAIQLVLPLLSAPGGADCGCGNVEFLCCRK